MAKMLGKETRFRRQGGWWWYCCPGHDGLWKHFIARNRKATRQKEKSEWRKLYRV